VTTRSRYHIDCFLEQFPAIAQVVRASCGLQDTRRLKPHPAPIQEAARRLGVATTHCVMVGDTSVDMRAAVRAGAWGVGVLSGFGRRDELLRAGAHVILPSSAELPALFQGAGFAPKA
jgi:phosphoglycolate phosphatase-like HAD superfamily hydrolase